nr:MAG TPA: hypothetical protein [Caudoviricetes sp.]
MQIVVNSYNSFIKLYNNVVNRFNRSFCKCYFRLNFAA